MESCSVLTDIIFFHLTSAIQTQSVELWLYSTAASDAICEVFLIRQTAAEIRPSQPGPRRSAVRAP